MTWGQESKGRSGAKRTRMTTVRGRRHPGYTSAQLATRAALLPPITYPDELPVSQRREQIATAIRDHQVTIVCGETGSGKTTQLPKICLELGRGIGAMIGHTQPRRLAARTVADRIAAELGGRVGGGEQSIIGYQVRFTDEVGPTTLVKLMTDGILLAEIQTDPLLKRYDTIIIDEAHERSLNIDFLIGYLTRLLPRRPDLKVIITSATIDSARFQQHFESAIGAQVPVIEVSGRTYPVEIRYRPLSPETSVAPQHTEADSPQAVPTASRADTVALDMMSASGFVLEDEDEELALLGYGAGNEIDYLTGICRAVDELCAQGPGDILVFLAGERDIRDTTQALRDHLGQRYIGAGLADDKSPLDGIEVMPLFSRLSSAEQHRIFTAHPRRRVVLATNVAETSLTVPGIRYVIDPGLARISRYSNRTKVQRLPIEAISQASANQRSGRCGRVAEGVAIRLYSARDFASREAFTEPEILRTSLASVILQMAALGLGEVEDFPFLDAPGAAAIKQGVAVLDEIGALQPRREGRSRLRLTRVGRDLARLPVDPRLARMLVEAGRNGCVSEVVVIVAALSMQDVRERPEAFQGDADAAHARFTDPTSDFLTYLSLWRYLHLAGREMSNSALRRLCKREFLHYLRWREWQDLVGQLTDLLRPLRLRVDPLELPTRADISFQARTAGAPDALARAAVESTRKTTTAKADEIHRSLLVGLLSNLGWWDPQRNLYEGARGARFAIWPGSGLARKHYDWVMAAELVETSRLFARTVARIDPTWAEPLAKHLVKCSYGEPYWSSRRGAAMVRQKVTLYGLTLVADRAMLLSHLPSEVPVHLVGASATSVAARSSVGEQAPTPAVELARDLFIRNALIDGNWDANYPFLRENQAVLDDIRASEQKLRTGGWVSQDALFAFYDERLPQSITSQQEFDSWWRRTPDKQALTLAREALVPDGDWDPQGFPSQWVQGDVKLRLSYEFTPGSSRDGLSVHVPLSVLARVEDRGFDWLVPGMLTELVTATIRALPKALRSQLVPAPQVAAEFAQWIRVNVWGERPSEAEFSGHDCCVCEESTPLASTLSSSGGASAGGQADSAASSSTVDPLSLEASLGRLAAWAQKTGAATPRTISKLRQRSHEAVVNEVAAPPSSAPSPTAGVTSGAAAVGGAQLARGAPLLPGTAAGADLPPFFEAFCRVARVLRGVDVSRETLEALDFPPHARAMFIIEDESGREIRAAEDLMFLKKQLSSQAQGAVRSAMRDALHQALRQQGEQSRKRLPDERRGGHKSKALKGAFAGVSVPSATPSKVTVATVDDLTQWPRTALPHELQTTTAAGLTVRGYPSLVPQGDFTHPRVGVRIHAHAADATALHRKGLAYLLLTRVTLSQGRVSTRWTGREALLLAAGPYRSTADLIAQAQYASALSLVDEYDIASDQIRNAEAFEQLATWVRHRHEDRVYQIIGYVVATFAEAAELDRAIRRHGAPSLLRVLSDVRAHCARLVNDQMLAEVDFAWLAHLPRFVKADRLRLEKAAQGASALSRDEGAAREVDALETAIKDRRAGLSPGDGAGWERLALAGWLLEELRVSLFAQELGTSQKVSVKRVRSVVSADGRVI